MIPAAVQDDLQSLVDALARSAPGPAPAPGPRPLLGAWALGPEATDAAIADLLYSAWYLGLDADPGQGPTAAGKEPNSLGPALEPPLAGALRAAHAGSSVFEPGWVVLTVLAHGACVAGRGTEQRLLLAGEYLAPQGPAVPVAPGEQVHAVTRVDTVEAATGWWATRSPAGEPDPPLLRIYLHPDVLAVAPLVRALTHALLAARHRWSLKATTQVGGYQRPDAVVLYVPSEHADAAVSTVRASVTAAGVTLQARTPPLAEVVAPGVATAHDPGPGTSFGTVLCQALAPGVRALLSPGAVATVTPLLTALTEAGIDPSAPWLGQSR